MSKSITSFGKEPVKAHCYEKKIGWPLYVWRALVSESIVGELDILQRLILSLALIGRLRDRNLFDTLGLSGELMKAVEISCVDRHYLDKNGDITQAGKQALSGELPDPLETDMGINYNKVYVFCDALTGDIVPNFTVTSLPKSYEDITDRWILPFNKTIHSRPSFDAISRAINIGRVIHRNIKSILQDYAAEDVNPSTNIPVLPPSVMSDDEVDWEMVGNGGEIAETPKYQQRAQQTLTASLPMNPYIKIIDDTPELIYADASVYVDPDVPKHVFAISPLSTNENSWFTHYLLYQARRDEAIQNELDLFVDMAMEELKHRYPFNNQLHIELFLRFPAIANQPEFGELKEQLESVKRAYNRISEGHMDYDTFYMRCQRTLECLLDYCIRKIPDRRRLTEKIIKYDFEHQIRDIASSLSIDLPFRYADPQFADRMEKVARMRGSTSKDRALFLLLDAYFREGAPALMVLRDMPDFFHSIDFVVNVRNKTAHYNQESLDDDATAEKIMGLLEQLVTVLFVHYLRG